MAKIWLVHGTQQEGPPIAERPWRECVALLEIDEFSQTEVRPKFGDGSSSIFPTDVVVQLQTAEASEVDCNPGYYRSPLTPDEAESRLGLR